MGPMSGGEVGLDMDGLKRGSALWKRLEQDYPYFAVNLLRVPVKKGGKPVPFRLNRPQWVVHREAEKMKGETGKVRVLLLKGRQMGASTYVLGRAYHRISMWEGIRSFILTHQQFATDALFGRLKLMHENMPVEFRPVNKTNNANELSFGALNSAVRVATAHGTKGAVGRGDTFQFFHGSEVALWPTNEKVDHFSGAMQALADEPGSEAWLESTAFGTVGPFYEEWVKAEKRQSTFRAIFTPWYWFDDYKAPVPEHWMPPRVIAEYMTLHRLTMEQGRWMQLKNWELKGSDDKIASKFRQEYPGSAAEAFQMTGNLDALIDPEWVAVARRRTDLQPYFGAAWVVGVDIARGGDDQTRIVDRCGRVMGWRINEVVRNGRDLMPIVDRCSAILNRWPEIRRMYIDITGVGAGVFDVLRRMGFDKVVVGVQFGAAASEEEKYVNKRAEIWGRMAEWLVTPGGVRVPDDDVVQRHLCAPQKKFRMNNELMLEAKEDLKKRVGFSPDFGDAGALTFTENLPYEAPPRPLEAVEFERLIDQGEDDGWGNSRRSGGFDYMGV